MANSVCQASSFSSIILHNEILSIETSYFLKQIIFLKSYDSVLSTFIAGRPKAALLFLVL